MPSPLPHQITGARFLADRERALLADEPRVGKTGAAIMAADCNLEEKVLVVTTASGRAVWRRAFADWSPFDRDAQVIAGGARLKSASAIVSWSGTVNPAIRAQLLARKWDRAIFDESHYAKSIETKRTASVYGSFTEGGAERIEAGALATAAGDRVWCLTGTPIPNAPNDLYPMLRALAPERLAASNGLPDVTRYQDFLHRYCVVRMKKLPRGFRKIPVVVGGRNLPELRERVGDFMLRRTQQDVGIREPIYETFPLAVSERTRRDMEADVDRAKVLKAAEAGDTKTLEMELGPLRRMTGDIKARATVEAVKEEFECGLDKIVLAYWHRDTGDTLEAGLSSYGVVRLDGATQANIRGDLEQQFLRANGPRVFLGQIKAAGEAIDLSSSANLWFVETSFTPADMSQMSKRITNHTQTRQCLVRVCVLEGSIDEALQEILLRKWSAIREVLTR